MYKYHLIEKQVVYMVITEACIRCGEQRMGRYPSKLPRSRVTRRLGNHKIYWFDCLFGNHDFYPLGELELNYHGPYTPMDIAPGEDIH